MKPIEIKIEGYKITISEDGDSPRGYKEVIEKVKPITVPGTSEPDWSKDDTILDYTPKPYKVYPCCPYTPPTVSPQTGDWWRYPYVTWTGGEMSTTTNTTATATVGTPVRDTMVGKSTTEGNAN